MDYEVVSFNIGSKNREMGAAQQKVIEVRPMGQFIQRVEQSIAEYME